LSAARPTSLATHGVMALNISGLVLGSVFCVVLSFVLASGRPDDPKASRWTFFALLAAGLVGCMMALRTPEFGNYGSNGIARTLGAVLLIIAVAKHDLLGVPLPGIVVRRSVLAGTALATLFIVAQIAQNFLAAEYGLIMGGIVAGAFLFAATPIQRALEGRGAARRLDVGEPPRDASRREDAYLDACRLAMRDKRLTRAEEARLHRLADELGLAPSRAHELLVQAEAEAGVA
jgi:hypothetical protein